jgi:uncharacterized iron-regulated membrane protein
MSRNPTVRRLNVWSRRLHRWGAIAAALPVVVILCTGLMLQLKKQIAWIQPPTQTGSGQRPIISFNAILDAARSTEQAGIRDWTDINRLDVRPDIGIVKVITNSEWEVQIDTATGAVLQTHVRRSDLIESLHDGTFFHEYARLGVFLPAGVLLLGLWLTGLYLWFLPIVARRNGRRRRAAGSQPVG